MQRRRQRAEHGYIRLDVYGDGSLIIEGAAPLIRLGERRAAPAAFEALFDRPGTPVVHIRAELLDGRFQCISIGLSSRSREVVDSTSLRNVPIALLLQEAVRGALHVIAFEITDRRTLTLARTFAQGLTTRERSEMKIGDAVCAPLLLNADAPTEILTHFLNEAAALQDSRRAKHQARLQRVAATYTEAFMSTQPTTRAVQKAENVSKQRAANLIAEARRQGLLPPTSRGRKSGQCDVSPPSTADRDG